MIKTCTQCGTDFDPGKRRAAKTCSDACSSRRVKLRTVANARLWRAENAVKHKEYCKEYSRNMRRTRDASRLCAHCGVEYGHTGRRSSKTCSVACANAYAREYESRRAYARAVLRREARATRKAETVSRMLAMLNSGELAAYGTEPYFLYRFYDEDDTLLYIGITNDPERRLYQHAMGKPWADDIARTEYSVFANKTAAAAAEAALIKELGPSYNIVHNKIPLTANEKRQ